MDSIKSALNSIGSQTGAESVIGYERLMDHRAVKMFRDKFPQITDEDLRRSQCRLRQMAVEFDDCSPCTGLDRCKHEQKGYFLALDVIPRGEGRFMICDKLKPCKYVRRTNDGNKD
jgi:hypothetical protein